MKRRALERHLVSQGCALHRHGGNHDVWVSANGATMVSVPRHDELKWPLVRGICRRLGVALPSGK